MTGAVLHEQAKRYTRNVPEIKPGYTVRVHEKIQEGGKERVQIFEGLVISVHNGHTPADASFVVRKIVSGIGVEKGFPLHALTIEKIEVKKVAKVRRAKLFFVRGRTGKAARMIERFTTDDEFQTAVADAAAPVMAEETVVEASAAPETPAAEEKKDEAAA